MQEEIEKSGENGGNDQNNEDAEMADAVAGDEQESRGVKRAAYEAR